MISGREAIREFWSDLIQSVNAKSATLTSDDVMTAGEGAVEIRARNAQYRSSWRCSCPIGSEVRGVLAAGGWQVEVAR